MSSPDTESLRHKLNRPKTGGRLRSTRGFTLIDVSVSVGVIGVMMAVAMPSVGTALQDGRANAGMRAIQGQLRAARDTAITQRRTVEVQFVGQNQIQVTRIEGTTRTTVATAALENGMQYLLLTGVPDTPDAYGNTQAVAFGGLTTMWFQSDGTLTDAAGLPLSGTVFLGVPSKTLSARAVTVTGSTGRVQAYRWDSRFWR
jgi:type IV fimbrial biogenesis protein FimT